MSSFCPFTYFWAKLCYAGCVVAFEKPTSPSQHYSKTCDATVQFSPPPLFTFAVDLEVGEAQDIKSPCVCVYVT